MNEELDKLMREGRCSAWQLFAAVSAWLHKTIDRPDRTGNFDIALWPEKFDAFVADIGDGFRGD